MIFTQACRGEMRDYGALVETDGGCSLSVSAAKDTVSASPRIMSDGESKIPNESDFFYGYATTEGYVAWRNSVYGSWYISELCQTLISYASYASLTDMMTITNDRVSSKSACKGQYKATSQYTSNLRKKVYFL